MHAGGSRSFVDVTSISGICAHNWVAKLGFTLIKLIHEWFPGGQADILHFYIWRDGLYPRVVILRVPFFTFRIYVLRRLQLEITWADTWMVIWNMSIARSCVVGFNFVAVLRTQLILELWKPFFMRYSCRLKRIAGFRSFSSNLLLPPFQTIKLTQNVLQYGTNQVLPPVHNKC
jgi:hypothetical protein